MDFILLKTMFTAMCTMILAVGVIGSTERKDWPKPVAWFLMGLALISFAIVFVAGIALIWVN